MLVLSRKAGEAIVLGGNITVYVLGVEGDRVKLGVDAPPEVLVLRSELLRNQYPMERPEPPPEYRPQPDYRRPRPAPRPIGAHPAHPPRYSRPPWAPGRSRDDY
ncbi:MAG TPA: carbon storage regulator [Ktedonobacterales bacterium]|nr:carbon storage regulator [Ktedonobacterales bacterium]